ncbi:MAG: hypothetical protein CFE37_01445 [Alphaproteobacteria bacterium PA4]|nr:MAG: hypothetical protein CFE37_01445 [Alphaproteobacteria bacterium PA4]
MAFQIHALDPSPYAPLFGLNEQQLAVHNARRVIATSNPGFPCRVSLADAAVGESLLLVNHQHLRGSTPYAASHAIYIREAAEPARIAPNSVPEVLLRRLLSVRAYDAASMMLDADVVDGRSLAPMLDALFARDDVAFIHLHNARPGCFAASVTRA